MNRSLHIRASSINREKREGRYRIRWESKLLIIRRILYLQVEVARLSLSSEDTQDRNHCCKYIALNRGFYPVKVIQVTSSNNTNPELINNSPNSP
jgi:hypothetical protein